VIVDALRAGVQVPSAYIKDGKIVLNLSMTATQRLQLKNDCIEFDARFAGVAHHVHVPMSAVLGIYARETGEGMIFSEAEGEPTPPDAPTEPDRPPSTPSEGRRAKLTVVK
jgi:stringent starvation protein B